ncbi:MAG: M20/M25/M40 family metallo-hydrolase, partial [Anaerolineaceae bacterium]|nr:M20/M25/M40 family metallo-hydrolase [Anaerolineaceae bacterium]
MTSDAPIYERPEELLQNLIRFDTTNPPGNEEECIHYINDLLRTAGFETTLLQKVPKRPNLITRLKGEGKAPPFLMYGHADVVTTADQDWSQAPFEGKIMDGYIWGRGALDMKGALAMMISAILRARADGVTPPGDVILAVVPDEEGGGDVGAKFLVEEHAHHFDEVRYAIGEAGGFNMEIGGKKFYPIQVAEKQICWLKAKLNGLGGHGSMP